MTRKISRRTVMAGSAAAVAAIAVPHGMAETLAIMHEPVPQPPSRDAIDDIQRVVARHYGVSVEDILGPERLKPIVRARWTGMYLARLMSDEEIYMIGIKFGARDMLNLVHACRRIEARRLTEPGFDDAIATMAADAIEAIEAIERNGHGPAAQLYAERGEKLSVLLEGKAYPWEPQEILLAKQMLTDHPTFYETLI